MQDESGQLQRLRDAVGERYRIDRELGAGGMATVYLADDLKHRRQVAIKVLKPELVATLGAERFLREIEIAAQLNHPNILTLIDSADAGGFLYYVMPFVEGKTLRERLSREKQLPIEDALQITLEVADALGYAHSMGVIHRDIKPENILFQAGHAVVSDFGIARAISEAGGEHITETGLAIGTPSYMSPEQAAGDAVDARSDIYSLGCVLYEMLAAEPPYTGPSAQAILARKMREAVPPLHNVRETVPEHVERAITQALAKAPADRFATASQFATAVGDITPVPVAARRPRRWRLAGLVALGGLVVTGGGTALFLIQARTALPPQASFIAVAPFLPTGSDTALARLGRDLVVTLSANLDGVGEIRTVDAVAILAQADEPGQVYTREQAAELARRLGASSVVHGSLLRMGREVRLDFGVFTSDSLEELARGSVAAPGTDLTALTDSATWTLLRGMWRAGTPPTPSLAAVTTSSIAALREFLDGEQAMFQNQWAVAESAYARAIEQDSTFWLAYQRYTYSRGWQGRESAAARETFAQHLDAIPERDRECWRAVYPWTAASALGQPPAPRSLSWHLGDLAATLRRYPDCWFTSWDYADDLVHRGPLFGYSAADAQVALERFLVLGPQFAPAWEHLLWMSLGRDTALSDRALEALARLEAQPAADRLMDRLVDRGFRTSALNPLLADSVARAFVASQQVSLARWIAHGFAEGAIEIGHRVLELGLPRHAAEPLRRELAMAWAARGAWDSALVVIDRLAEGTAAWAALDAYRLATVGAWLGALQPREAHTRRRAASASLGRSAAADSAELWWLDGVLAAATGDEQGLANARAALRQLNDSTARLLEPTLVAFSLELGGDPLQAGHLVAQSEWTLSEGQDQAGRAVPRAEWLGVIDAPAVVRAVNRLAASRWLLAGGDTVQAERLIRWHEAVRPSEQMLANAIVAAIAYLNLGRIEDARGRSELARAHYRQFLRRYDLPVPEHRHQVAEAEAALAHLGRREELAEPR